MNRRGPSPYGEHVQRPTASRWQDVSTWESMARRATDMTSAPSVARPGRLTPSARAAASLEAGGPIAGGRLPIEVRTLRVGMRVTLLAPLAAAAMFVLASRTRVALGGYGLLLTGLAVAAALATLLPWDRLMERRAGLVLLSAWAV